MVHNIIIQALFLKRNINLVYLEYAFIKMVMLKKLFGKIAQLIIVIGFLRNRYKLEQLHLVMICLLKMELNNYFKHNLYILSLRVLIVQIIYKSNIFKIIIQL